MEEGDNALTEDDAAQILEELLPAQNHSYVLGLKLKLPLYVVESIHSPTYPNPRDRLLRVIIEFLQRLTPTWRAIVDALRSPAVQLSQLALTIEGKRCLSAPQTHRDRSLESNAATTSSQHASPPIARITTVEEVRAKIRQFEDKFKAMKRLTRQGLERQGESASVRVVVERLTDLSADDQPDHAMFLRENMHALFKADDHHELFGTLNFYWNYLTYHLLDHLVVEFSITEVKGEMEVYKVELGSFRQATPLRLFSDAQTRRHIPTPPDFKKVAGSFQWSDDATLEHVEEFRRAYAFHYKLRECAMMLLDVHCSTVYVTWFVPESTIERLKTDIPVALFEKFCVISLQVADSPVYVNTKHQHDLANYFIQMLELKPFVLSNVRPTGTRIGVGSYGSVEEVEMSGTICAAKKIHDIFQDHYEIPDTDMSNTSMQFVKECQLMSSLRHPHIVQFLGVCFIQGSQLPALVMERLLTSLHDLLDPEMKPPLPSDVPKPFFPLSLKCSILHDVASGLAYLHEQSPPIIHRDLSARNILLNSGMVAKIADLGVARIIPRTWIKAAATMTKAPGASVYMPPEALESMFEESREKTKYDISIDVFSFGVVSIFTLSQTFPCNLLAPNYRDEQRRIKARSELERRDEYVQKIELREDHPLLQMIKRCLDFPEDRPFIWEVLLLLQQARVEEGDKGMEMNKLELIRALHTPHGNQELQVESLERSMSAEVTEQERRQAKASKAKVQRLEKERREMEKTIEGFRKSQAKLVELERTNKKLQEQTHADRRESIRLKEELQVYKTRTERLSKLQSAMRSQEHKLEEVDAAMKKITELKQQNALLSETKVLLQDEVTELHSRLERLSDVQAENTALNVRVESQETELREEGLRMQTLLQQNVQMELDRDRKVAEIEAMQVEMTKLKLNQPRDEVPFAPAGPLLSEQDIALQTKVLHLEKDKRELEQSLQMLKRSQERVDSENQNMKQKLTEQLHSYRKEVAKLKEELQREKSHIVSLQSGIKSAEITEPDQRQAGRSYSPREVHILKEEAAEAHTLKQSVHHLQQENHSLKADMEDARIRYEASVERLQSRLQMLEQLNNTLEEEKSVLRDQMNKLMSQNQDLLKRTLDSKDQAIVEERMFNDRLGELERDKARLTEQLIAQQREHLVREMDILKRSKSKNLLKSGFKKLTVKTQGRSHTFETNMDPNQSPSHIPLGLPRHEGSMSSNQSLNSDQEVKPQEEIDTTSDTATACIPKGPTITTDSPYTRKKRSNTMPTNVKLRHPPSSSPRVIPEINEDLMSLEDFLAKSDRTPNRRGVMELKRDSLTLNTPTPPVSPRNSLLLTAPHSASASSSGEKMFDLQEFLTRGHELGNVRQSISEVETERPLSNQPATEFLSQGSDDSDIGSQGLSSSQELSQQSDMQAATELNVDEKRSTL